MAGRGEFGLIADLFEPLAAGYPGALSLHDDAALVEVDPGHRLVVTTDALVAGVHFLPDDPPDLVARKALRVNLSDVAAMGARPVAVLVAACFPKEAGEAWAEIFARGLAEDVRGFGVPLIGGDTVATPGPATITVTALGQVAVGHELRRDAAREGDVLLVSGTIGDGALGLLVQRGRCPGLSDAHREFLIDRYRLPQPRVTLGPELAGIARACLDVSDGLIGDVGHICRHSGLGAVIDVDAVPLSPAAAAAVAEDAALLRTAVLCGGDDYELAFTVPAERVGEAQAAAAACGVTVTAIGVMVAGDGVKVRSAGGAPEAFTESPAWRHF
ncbi:thiamine-phosphate kinase [Caenispirillum bisanense]|uniref:Thiamine-monophosphate kinase n=1 Tax=Caenispirillum bisanense TaxID=414052 RepID=A0A286GFE9_9PROT|nr:thiamine-phosphate kinase [Caenispirillum bisanense]SOD94255.1 thiamine-phosphate kinase [Caenispirillum bisanense]